MIWLMLGLVYGLGYLWTYRYVVGTMIDDMGFDEWVDIAFCMFFGALFTILWPLIVGFRGIYVLFTKYGPSGDTLQKVFPAFKEIEARQERESRILREREEALDLREEELAKRERWEKREAELR